MVTIESGLSLVLDCTRSRWCQERETIYFHDNNWIIKKLRAETFTSKFDNHISLIIGLQKN